MNAPIIVDDVRVRGVGKSFDSLGKSVWAEVAELEGQGEGEFREVSREVEKGGKCEETASTYFEEGGRRDVPVYVLEKLEAGDVVKGPGTSTLFGLFLLTDCEID
jgi:5-oxoprolinase (ATP-hydrolysing)